MDKQEVQHAIENALHGNWLPIGIILGLCGVVIVLFIFILKVYRDQNEIKHSQTNEELKELMKNSNFLSKMVAVHDAEISNLKK